jgi:hypothetical protein
MLSSNTLFIYCRIDEYIDIQSNTFIFDTPERIALQEKAVETTNQKGARRTKPHRPKPEEKEGNP